MTQDEAVELITANFDALRTAEPHVAPWNDQAAMCERIVEAILAGCAVLLPQGDPIRSGTLTVAWLANRAPLLRADFIRAIAGFALRDGPINPVVNGKEA